MLLVAGRPVGTTIRVLLPKYLDKRPPTILLPNTKHSHRLFLLFCKPVVVSLVVKTAIVMWNEWWLSWWRYYDYYHSEHSDDCAVVAIVNWMIGQDEGRRVAWGWVRHSPHQGWNPGIIVHIDPLRLHCYLGHSGVGWRYQYWFRFYFILFAFFTKITVVKYEKRLIYPTFASCNCQKG